MLNGMTDHQPSSFHAQTQWTGLTSLPCDVVSENWRSLKTVTAYERLHNTERTLSTQSWTIRKLIFSRRCLWRLLPSGIWHCVVWHKGINF